MKLHLGCGNDIRDGWVNVDSYERPGVTVVDLDACDTTPLPWDTDSVDHIEATHLLEHIRYPLPLLAELWRVAKPDATAIFRTPYGSSDDAWEDPTHVRPYFAGSWSAFSRPYYWRVDDGYGYQADWQPTRVVLHLEKWAREASDDPAELWSVVQRFRNTVHEQVAELQAIKPARAPDRTLLCPPNVEMG